jgi:hypothetical protein
VAYVADGRGAAMITRTIGGFSGILQVDGYPALARDHGGSIQLASCLAHSRRKFVKQIRKGVQVDQLAVCPRGDGADRGDLCH